MAIEVGGVSFVPRLDTKRFKRDVARLKKDGEELGLGFAKNFDRGLRGINFKAFRAGMKATEKQMAQAITQAVEAKNKYKSLTDEYRRFREEAQKKVDFKMTDLESRKKMLEQELETAKKLRGFGNTSGVTRGYEQIKSELKQVTAQMRELADSGWSAEDIAKADEYKNKIKEAGVEMLTADKIADSMSAGHNVSNWFKSKFGESYESLRAKLKSIPKLMGATLVKGFVAPFKLTANITKSVFSSMFNNLKKIPSLAGRAFGSILKWARRITLGAIVAGIALVKKGMDNLVKADSRTANSINSLRASVKGLGNALASAFAPILNYVTPILTKFIGVLTKAANAVAMFVARLTGQNSVVVATGAVADGVDSIGDSASGANDSAKELQRTLMGFDKINKLDALNDSGSSGSGGSSSSGSGMGFETVPIDSVISDWADKFKRAWEDADFTEIGNTIGTKLKNVLDSIDWNSVQSVGAKIGKSIATGINGFIETDGLGTSIGTTIAESLNTITITLNSFAVNFNWDSLGRFVADEINGFFSSFDWSLLGQTVSAFGTGILDTLNLAISNINWENIGKSIVDFISNIDWVGLLTRSIELVGNIANAVFDTLQGAIKEAKKNLKQWIESGKIWDDLFEIGKKVVEVTVDLIKGAWGLLTEITGLVKEVGISLFKSGWKKISWFLFGGTNEEGEERVGIILKLFKTIKEALFGSGKSEGNETVNISLSKTWTTIKEFIFGTGTGDNSQTQTAKIGLGKSGGWTTVLGWLTGSSIWGTASLVADIMLGKSNSSSTSGSGSGWLGQSVTGFIKKSWFGSTTLNAPVGLSKSSGSSRRGGGADWLGYSATGFLKKFWWGSTALKAGIGLKKGWKNNTSYGWKTVTGYVVSAWLGKGYVSIGVELFKSGWRSLRSFFGLSSGGINTGHGFRLFGDGGIVPRYADGGLPDGSQLFWARESGPELVGTLGSRTAVMNNDQIVASVSSGVARAMSAVRFKMNATPQLIMNEGNKQDNSDVIARDNAQIINLLTQLVKAVNDKDFEVNLDGRAITRNTVENINNQIKQTGVSPIML